MKVKVKVQLQVGDEAGRKCWIVRTPDGLAFGNIYTTEETASALTQEELGELTLKAPNNFIILNITQG